MTTVVESIATNVRARWDAELSSAGPGDIPAEDAAILPLLVRDLANAMARISVLEREVLDLRDLTGVCR